MLFEGLDSIAEYVGRNRDTVSRWIRIHGFPACRLPNGNYATSESLIDAWIIARMNKQAVFDKNSKI